MAITKVRHSVIEDNTIPQAKIHGGGITPTGTILPFSVSTPPEGWLICDGSEVNRGDYPDLFALFDAEGLPHGSGDGSTTFTLPDLATRVAVGKGTGKTLGTKGGAMNMTPSGSVSSSASGGGVDNATLSNQQLPVHNHGGGNHNHQICATSIHIGAHWAAGGGGNHGNGYACNSGTIINSCGCGWSHGHSYTNPSVSSSFTGNSMSVEQPYTVLNYIIKY